MLIVIFILLCLMFFLTLLILGEVALIKKRLYQKQAEIRRLPQVKPDILRTMAEDIEKIKRMDGQGEAGQRWANEFYAEQPVLASYLHIEALKTGEFDVEKVVPAYTIYRLLKAQTEADSLADLTKIRE